MLRIALRGDTTRDAIDDVTREAGLLLLNILAGSATHPAQIIYASRDRRTAVHLIEDARLGALYFVLQGSDEATIAGALRAGLPVLPDQEIRALASAAAPRDVIRGVALLAITAGPAAEPASLELFRAALRHADADVRNAARSAAAYVPWPELQEAVLHAAMVNG